MTAKILIVDDHDETRRLISLILQEHDYEVLSAESGMEALPLAEAELPDLVLLDIMMPEMDGYEVCRRFRATPTLVGIPIIMFTSKGQGQEKWEGFKAGADDYLVKPTRPDEMINRIETILATRQASRRAARAAADDLADFVGPPADLTADPSEVATDEDSGRSASGPSRLIAVLGSRGGAGATTAAINLAVSLADTGCSTVLADLDLNQGHIAAYLNQKVGVDVAGLAGRLEAGGDKLLTHYEPNLQLLLVQPARPHQQLSLTEVQTVKLLEQLRYPGRTVVVDLGRVLTPMALAVLERADVVLVCLRPERVAVTAARQLLQHLEAYLASAGQIRPVLLDFNAGANLPRAQLERYLGHALSSVITLRSTDLAQAVNRGQPVVRVQPDGPAAVKFQELAQQVMHLAPAE